MEAPHYEAKSFVVNQLDKKYTRIQTEIARGTRHPLSMCVFVCVSLSICIAYLTAIWHAKQYEYEDRERNRKRDEDEDVLSMATKKS